MTLIPVTQLQHATTKSFQNGSMHIHAFHCHTVLYRLYTSDLYTVLKSEKSDSLTCLRDSPEAPEEKRSPQVRNRHAPYIPPVAQAADDGLDQGSIKRDLQVLSAGKSPALSTT